MAKNTQEKNVRSVIDSAALDKVELLINSTFHGSVTFIIQDSCVIQIERNEKLRLNDLLNKSAVGAKTNDSSRVRTKILESISGLKYGQIVVVIKNGAVVQIEKTEKSRFTEWEGVDGEGI